MKTGNLLAHNNNRLNLHDAISLIKPGMTPLSSPQHWADLGCGNGTFTYALAHVLSSESKITAVDSSPQRLNAKEGNGVSILFLQADFDKEDFRLPMVDGILMANSFHYIRQKESFVKRIANYLNEKRKFLIIEYEADIPNPWVPYPIGFNKLRELFASCGYGSVKKINEKPSVYGGKMYVALVESTNMIY